MTRHYCYVPGRGAYMLADQPAVVSATPGIGQDSRRIHTLSAPRRIVHFSPLHTHDDGLLANLLMEAEGMTYDEACRYISRQAPLLSEDFAESAALHTDTDNFGFEDCHVETWADLEQRLKPAPIEKPAAQNVIIGNRDTETVAIPKYWLQHAAAILLIAIFFFTNFIGLNKDNSQLAGILDVSALQQAALVHQTWDETDELSDVSEEDYDDADVQDADADELDDDVAMQDDEAADLNDVKDSQALSAAVSGTTYYIIVSVSSTENFADCAYKHLVKDGHENAGILVGQNGNFCLYLEHYNNLTEAANHLRTIRRNDEKFSNAWILTVEEGSLSYIIKNKYNDNQLSMELSHPNQRTERDQG